jgi:uncharacterized protein (TIGR00297 family)
MTEFHWFGLLIASATILTGFGEISARKGWISLFNARKGVHVTVALCCAIAIELIPINNWFIGAVGAIVVLLLYSVSKKWFSIDHPHNRTSWGIFYFGLSYFLLLIFWGEKSPVTVILAMAVMGLADATAALVGRSFPIPALKLGNEDKSWAGSSTFFMISSILLFGALHLLNWLNYPMAMLVLFCFILWLTLIENSSANGTDNLSVPLVFGVLFPFLFGPLNRIEVVSRFLEILPFVTLFGLLTFRFKSLSRSGTITAISLGVLLYSLGGWIFIVPILAFFISGSVLSHLLQTNEQVLEKTGARDPLQVIANGGAPLLALLYGVFCDNMDWAIMGFLGSVASVTSDTWSTEWGMRFGGTPRHILNMSRLEKGLSGGVTLSGFIGAIGGSVFIASMGLFFMAFGTWFWAIIVIGVFGSVIDSILGLLQAKYQLPESSNKASSLTEKKEWNGTPLKKVKGLKWIGNDLVNFCSSLFALFASLLFAAITP